MRIGIAATGALLLSATFILAPAPGAWARDTPSAGAMNQVSKPAPQFDAQHYISVSEVKVGMKGYGLSVFKGTKIQRFDVEVLSVLKNFNPKYDVVLINCKGANLEHTGSIAGMSGSPIYLKDDQGHDRMLGAFAYGWPMTKDPIAGVQPIQYMLTLPVDQQVNPIAGGPTTAPAATTVGPSDTAAEPRAIWFWRDAAAQWQALVHPASERPARMALNGENLAGNGDAPRLEPLATPLMTAGLSPRLLEQLGPAFKAAGLVMMQGGIGGSGVAEEPPATLEPGAALAVPLLTGDTELTAIGTVTEVRDGYVYGFGHAFNNEGTISLPMGSGRINGVVANLNTSFKLGSLTKVRGTLTTDQMVGVGGLVGPVPAMVPIDFHVTDAAGQQRDYHFRGAVNPKFTPLICNAAFAAAVGGMSDLPQYNTVDYDVEVEFTNGRSIHVMDTAVNTSPPELFQGIGLAMIAASENPFQRVLVKKLSGAVKVASGVRAGQILEVNVPRLKYKPGETVRAFVTYKPFRAEEAILPVELDLPRDIPQGTYHLVISDADRYFQDEQTTQPFRFTAEKAQDVFDVLTDVAKIRHNAMYVRLVRNPDGVAIGRTAMPRLPSSKRQILLASGRSNTTPFASSVVKVIPTHRVMSGSAEFQIEVETHSRAESGTGPGPTSRPSVITPKAVEPKVPKSGPMEAPGTKDENKI